MCRAVSSAATHTPSFGPLPELERWLCVASTPPPPHRSTHLPCKLEPSDECGPTHARRRQHSAPPAALQPTAFKDIGKLCSDLLSKDYKTGSNSVEVKSKVPNGIVRGHALPRPARAARPGWRWLLCAARALEPASAL